MEREQAGAARLQAVSKRWAEVEALVGWVGDPQWSERWSPEEHEKRRG